MHTLLITASLTILTNIDITPAGGCFLWMDDGSRSSCVKDIDQPADCEKLGKDGRWDRAYFIPVAAGERFDCEDENGKPGGIFAVRYERDANDIDRNGKRDELIRWRYVVCVSVERDEDGCREKHTLCSGWSNDVYS